MTQSRYVEPIWQRWELAADPRMVWIPMFDGQVCGVMAHLWDLDGPEARFFVSIQTEHGLDKLEIAAFPKGLLADEKTLRASLEAKDIACDNPVGSPSAVLVSPPGTKVIVAQHPPFQAWPTITGLEFHVMTELWSREGPYVCFNVAVEGWPKGAVPVCVDLLRFPASILPEERRDSMARNW